MASRAIPASATSNVEPRPPGPPFVMATPADLDTATTDRSLVDALDTLALGLEADGQPPH